MEGPEPRSSYLAATRHPWSCFLFLLPLLAAYEGGVLWVGGAQPDALRNGADAWLRWCLEAFGLYQLYWAPALLIGLFLVWSWVRREDRPDDVVGVWLGMAIESVAFALLLWGLSQGLEPGLRELGIELSLAGSDDEGLAQLVTFVGAGIYEETLFRLVLYSGLFALMRWVRTPPVLAVAVAAVASATVFAAAHHVGPYGEDFDDYVFLFRSLAGLYFALLYQMRGFGVAAGAHACYDVLVGIALG
jgi:membrane protease YdiL (CAAX protease family)